MKKKGFAMTLDNYKYRTSPFFLRNTFYGVGKYDMPIIPKCRLANSNYEKLKLLSFDQAKRDDGKHKERMIHFFLYDYKFEKVWSKADKQMDILKPYKAVLTPDFSVYLEMHPMQQLYNTFRNRWCGAYFASKGLEVIPTVNWGLENTYDFCFEGIEKSSTVAVSTYMWQAYEEKPAQKKIFLNGYNEMLEVIQPERIICYHEPFDEMEGNIVYINYDQSSWRYLND